MLLLTTLAVDSAMVLSIFTELCNLQLDLTPHEALPAPRIHCPLPVSVHLPVLGISCKWNRALGGPPSLH